MYILPFRSLSFIRFSATRRKLRRGVCLLNVVNPKWRLGYITLQVHQALRKTVQPSYNYYRNIILTADAFNRQKKKNFVDSRIGQREKKTAIRARFIRKFRKNWSKIHRRVINNWKDKELVGSARKLAEWWHPVRYQHRRKSQFDLIVIFGFQSFIKSVFIKMMNEIV